MKFEDLVCAAQSAESIGDLDGCAACQLQMLEMVRNQPDLLQTVDKTYLQADSLFKILAAAVLAFERGEDLLAKYYLENYPLSFLEKPFGLPEYRELLAQIVYHQGDFTRTEELLREHLKRYPQDELAWFFLGNAAYHLGHFQNAILAYTQALHQKASFQDAAENRMQSLKMMMSPEGGAIGCNRRAIKRIVREDRRLGKRATAPHLHQLQRSRDLSFETCGVAAGRWISEFDSTR
ncbi:MAG: tetratricopeptide repeat protein [Selenomonadaceae bacterium]|nr:tetratricopeptide repeat protein [Selenomonadaceae bacterium]